jgi:calcineurin-like phosphoesterase family protein
MDEEILDCINKTVPSLNSILYHLGDFGFTSDIASYRRRIKCRDVRIVIGNHDHRARLMSVFPIVVDTDEIKLGDSTCWLAHYPHAIWPKSHYNSYHLYGHLHRQREDYFDRQEPERRSMDVGIENALVLLGESRPFSEEEILARLSPRKGHDPLSFYKGNGDYSNRGGN